MEKSNLVNETFTKANRSSQGDNRNYFVKALNKVLADGFINIRISEKGKIWTNPKFIDSKGNKKTFNVEIRGYGYIKRVDLGEAMSCKDILREVGKFIQEPKISDMHISSISVSGYDVCECGRCKGVGFIPQFNYYCDGICFNCYGSKYEIIKTTTTL